MPSDRGGHGPFPIADARCTAETDKAILVESENVPDGKMWVPKSCIHDDSEVYEQDGTGTLVVKEWWAEKNGLG